AGPRVEQTCTAFDDVREIVGGIELQARHDAEPVAQGIGEHAGTGGGAHQGEGLQVDLHAAGGRPFADHDVDLEIFHGRVEDFFDHGRQPGNFVDEEEVVRFQVGEIGRASCRTRDEET